MALALSAGDWVERVRYPAPADFPDAGAWLDALLSGESARGPQHGAEPALEYSLLWALWLSAVPYGLWSEQIAGPSMEEHLQVVAQLEQVLREGLDHFGLALREDTTVNDLAHALASLVEGVWLNQCLTTRHPSDPSEPIATALRRAGRLLWRGRPSLAHRLRGRMSEHRLPEPDRPWMMRTYAGHSTARAVQRALPRQPGQGPDRALDRLRPAHPDRLRRRPRAGARGGRQGRRAGGAQGRHARAAGRHPAGPHEHVDDDQRHGGVAAGALHRRGRGERDRRRRRSRARPRTTSSRSTSRAAPTPSRPRRRCG